MTDLPLHLGQSCVKAEIDLFQGQLDGLYALMCFCEGFNYAGKGQIPGAFELVMHYRSIRSGLAEALKSDKQEGP